MIRVSGEVAGEVQFNRALSRLVSSTKDFTVPFTKIGEDFRDIEKEQFDSEGYGKWAPLSPSYAAWKKRYFPNAPILVLFGVLRNAMTRKGFPSNVTQIGKTEAAFGASGKTGQIGRWHQLGTRNMPARRVIDLREVDKRMFTKTVHTYAVRLGKDSGFTLT